MARATEDVFAKRFNEADIDFDAIDRRVGGGKRSVPPKLSLTDVLDRLRKRLVEQQAEGGDGGSNAVRC